MTRFCLVAYIMVYSIIHAEGSLFSEINSSSTQESHIGSYIWSLGKKDEAIQNAYPETLDKAFAELLPFSTQVTFFDNIKVSNLLASITPSDQFVKEPNRNTHRSSYTWWKAHSMSNLNDSVWAHTMPKNLPYQEY